MLYTSRRFVRPEIFLPSLVLVYLGAGPSRLRASLAAILAGVGIVLFTAGPASGADGGRAVRLTWAWAAAQLLPSPELASGNGSAYFGVRWQLTPILYSYGIHRSQNRWRSFVVEPIVRQSGSIELYFSPELVNWRDRIEDGLGFRLGARSYFPLLSRGDYLSVSLGSAYAQYGPERTAAFEVGAYALFGFLGIQFSFLPHLDRARYVTTLCVRVF
jgi:hypothetical protein